MRQQTIISRVLLCAATIFFAAFAAQAEVRLPHVFGSHMVFQREKPIIIWGWAEPGETVTVEFGSAQTQAQANAKGEWKATLPAMKAGGPYTLTVSGSSRVKFDDILVGEVWLCSGQSNMEMGISQVDNAKEEIAAATNTAIRLLLVKRTFTPLPQNDIDGTWKICSPETIVEGGWEGFSAAAYFFGRNLQKELGVPVGLIESSWGGTRVEPWTPPRGFAAVPALKGEYALVELGDPRTPEHQRRVEKTLDKIRLWLADAETAASNKTIIPDMPAFPAELQPPRQLQNATVLYNGMIHPLIPFAIRGAIWYQGESNLGDGALYASRMQALIEGWRKLWHEGNFPFYYVQIAPYNYGGDPQAEARLWEAQTKAQSVPGAGMIVINDIGNLANIHPKNKQEVGRRLALWALAKTYHKDIPVYTGPAFQSMSVDGDKLVVTFDHVGGGLATRDGKAPDWFQIIDADEGGFVKAGAKIDGPRIILTAPDVKHPVAVRFAWSMMAEPNLMNAEGLPAGAFRSGELPKRDLLYRDVPEARDYQLVYDLDLNKLGRTIKYDVDNRGKIHQPFDRIAYFLELQKSDGDTQYLYVSMDAFTHDLGKIGVPTVGSKAFFQQNVAHMDVYSNVKTIVPGVDLPGGNIEFWPNNYGQANSAHVPNASSETYDFGDQPMGPPEGYGSMQVHNHDARQTLFAVNHWSEGAGADAGIGNRPEGNPDWTFAGNAGSWEFKRLRILVRGAKSE